jgi:hypothetical protein
MNDGGDGAERETHGQNVTTSKNKKKSLNSLAEGFCVCKGLESLFAP